MNFLLKFWNCLDMFITYAQSFQIRIRHTYPRPPSPHYSSKSTSIWVRWFRRNKEFRSWRRRFDRSPRKEHPQFARKPSWDLPRDKIALTRFYIASPPRQLPPLVKDQSAHAMLFIKLNIVWPFCSRVGFTLSLYIQVLYLSYSEVAKTRSILLYVLSWLNVITVLWLKCLVILQFRLWFIYTDTNAIYGQKVTLHLFMPKTVIEDQPLSFAGSCCLIEYVLVFVYTIHGIAFLGVWSYIKRELPLRSQGDVHDLNFKTHVGEMGIKWNVAPWASSQLAKVPRAPARRDKERPMVIQLILFH